MSSYHVDSKKGDDRNDGLSSAHPWKTLARAMRQRLRAGDALLLKRGSQWKEPLRIQGSGRPGRPIVLGTYGAGPKPRLVGRKFPLLSNHGPVSWWLIKGLELRGARSFDPAGKKQGEEHGIWFHQSETSTGMRIEDCVVHDVNGAGITFSAGEQGRTAFRDWVVSRCEVFNAGTGIATQGPWPPKGLLQQVYRCHEGFLVEHCRVHDIATDGIVLYYCQDGVIEHCQAWRTGLGRWHRTPVGIWFFMAARCAIQFCESHDNHSAGGHADGGGFDLDGGCVDCVMQYNYSHDNDGAGFLICSYEPVHAPTKRCITRFNLSVNDGRMNDYASIQVWQADDCSTYNNTCITKISSCLKFASETRGHLFANNIFYVDSDQDIPVLQSEFGQQRNSYHNNVFWRTGGKASFRFKNVPKGTLADLLARIPSASHRSLDPRLTATDGPDIHCMPGSPALKGGHRLKGMGRRDLYGDPLKGAGPVPIGASARGRTAARGLARNFKER